MMPVQELSRPFKETIRLMTTEAFPGGRGAQHALNDQQQPRHRSAENTETAILEMSRRHQR